MNKDSVSSFETFFYLTWSFRIKQMTNISTNLKQLIVQIKL